MASALQPIQMQWPYKGMNTHSPASEIDPAESPRIENAVITPYEARVRRGMKRKVNHGQYHERVHDDIILAVYNTDSTFVIATRDYQDGNHAHPYYVPGTSDTKTLPSGFTDNEGTTVTSRYSATTLAYVSGFGSGVGKAVFGRSVQIDGLTAAPSWETSSGGLTTLKLDGGGYNTASGTLGANLNTGDVTVTLAATVANSLKNSLFNVTGGDSYDYRIAAHTAGTATLTLQRPFGYGDPAVASVVSGTAYTVSTTRRITVVPGIATLETYQGRLFGGRANVYANAATTRSHYGNAIVWSYPYNPYRWPDQNYLIIDEDPNDPITGLATHAGGMFVFKRNKTFLLRGYDESSFQLDPFDQSVGCISDTSIHTANGILFWMAEEGVMAFDGSKITNISRPADGKGIYGDLLAYRNNGTTSKYRLRSSINSTGDYLFVNEHDYGNVSNNGSVPDTWVYNLNTGAWSKFTSGSVNFKPILFHKMNDRLYAITQNFVADITDCYEIPDSTTASGDYLDEGYSATSTSTSTATISAVIDMVAVPYQRNLARLQEVEVAHNCQYGNATSSPRTAWTIKVARDPLFSYSTASNIAARYAGNVTTPSYEYYFSDRITPVTNLVGEGAVFRVRLESQGSNVLSTRLLSTRLYLEPQPSRHGQIDNPTL